jgi:hypothetical protein
VDVHVRGIDPEVWRALRVESTRRGISVAQLIEQLWSQRPLAPGDRVNVEQIALYVDQERDPVARIATKVTRTP